VVCSLDFGVNVHILFSLFTNDPKHVTLSKLSNLKSPIVRLMCLLQNLNFNFNLK
jgi:hypothetical protein